MSSAATKRTQKELAALMAEPLEGITVIPDDTNLLQWKVLMQGPEGTPYQGGRFAIKVTYGLDFPFKPPTINFLTKMYHPNIDSDGNICVGVLKLEAWKPSTKMTSILLSLYDLLQAPNPDDALVTSIAEQYRSDRKAFDAKAMEYTRKYAV